MSRAIAIFLVKSITTILLLSPQMLLIAMTSDPLLGVVVVVLWSLLSWVVVWFYADAKARDAVDFSTNLLFVPLLVITSTFGLIFWFVFQLQQRRKAWYRKQEVESVSHTNL
jgi:heme/copper-type cytochrome/quinol oxidase subunit 2